MVAPFRPIMPQVLYEYLLYMTPGLAGCQAASAYIHQIADISISPQLHMATARRCDFLNHNTHIFRNARDLGHRGQPWEFH